METQRIHVLGEGVTGQAVNAKVNELEGYRLSPLEDADLIIASPGIPPHQYPKVAVPIISELEFAYRLFHRAESSYRPKLICTTGTNGKTTLTSLLAHALKVPAAGNIGTPLITFVDDPNGTDWIAVEASSYQLYSCDLYRPEIAVMLPITDDHLTWHQHFDHYAQSKAKIFSAQNADDTLIYPEHCPIILGMLDKAAGKVIAYSPEDPALSEIRTALAGEHNTLTVLAATKAIEVAGLMTDDVQERLETFKALPHRLEKIYEDHGIRIYNDSKATNPDSTIKAIESFSTPIRLILCGDDKGLDYGQFMAFLHDHVVEIVVFGGLSDKIRIASELVNPEFPCRVVTGLDDAVQHCVSEANEGDIVLFSPSSSSFDLFRSYADRGDAFKESVRQIILTTYG